MTNMFVTMFAKEIKVFSIFDSFVKKKEVHEFIFQLQTS